MMLYFYILDTPQEGASVLVVESKAAEIINGLIRPANGNFFHSAVGSFLMQSDIGRLSGRRERPIVILKEPDLQLARKLLTEHARKEVNHYQAMTDLWQRRLDAAEGSTE